MTNKIIYGCIDHDYSIDSDHDYRNEFNNMNDIDRVRYVLEGHADLYLETYEEEQQSGYRPKSPPTVSNLMKIKCFYNEVMFSHLELINKAKEVGLDFEEILQDVIDNGLFYLRPLPEN